MINVATNLKNAITGKGSQLIKIEGYCYDTSNVFHSFTWTNANIVQDSFYIDKRCVSGSQFSFGNTVSNELGFELFGSYEDWLLEGVSVTVSLGGYVSGTATYFEVGKFILDKPTQGQERLTCKGYDYLTKLDENADNFVLNINSGENILGQAIKPHPQYLMNASGYSNYIAGSVTSPYYNSNPLSAATGMVPLSQNGHYPRKIVIKATGNSVVLADSYFILFYYNGGSLEVVSGFTWAFDYTGYYSSSTVSATEYQINFDVESGHTKTKFQEYLETLFGEHDYFIAYTLTTATMGSFTNIEIAYGSSTVAKIGDTVAEICSACGLDFTAGYPAPDNLTLEYNQLTDYSQYSYRTILGLFAQACGANLTLWPAGYSVYDGNIRFAIPTSTGVTLDETNVMSCKLADEAVLINGARYVSSSGALYINRTDNTEPYKYFDFSGCPVFPRSAQTAVDNLAAMTGSTKTWLPGSAKILAMPWLEPMDVVTFAYTQKPNYSGRFMITRVHINANGTTTIESAGYNQTTTNSNGYVATDYTPVAPFGLVYSSFSDTVTPGTTSNVPMASFTENLPTVNDYVRADSGFGVITDINGSFATVKWLDDDSGSGPISVPTKTSDLINDGADGTSPYLEADETAYRTSGIPYGQVDSTSTSTRFTATVPGITELRDGVCMWLKNGVVTSADGFTININDLGAKPSYTNMAAATRDTTLFNVNYTMFFVYDSTRVSGGCWVCYRGYDANTLAYQVRTNSMSLPVSGALYRYRLLFTSADGTKFVPANSTNSTSATSTKTTTTTPIDPFGSIRYYASTSTVSSGSRPSTAVLYQQYPFTLGYSFNTTGAALTMTSWRPVYVKAAPQADGSAIIDATTPFVQALPSSADGKIYILLGVAYSATSVELLVTHPVYYYNGGIKPWTGINTSGFEVTANKVTAIGEASTNTEYPSAKAAYDALPAYKILTSDSYYGFTAGTPTGTDLAAGIVAQAVYNDFVDYVSAGEKSIVIIDDAKLFDYGSNDSVKAFVLSEVNESDGEIAFYYGGDAANYTPETLIINNNDAYRLIYATHVPHFHGSINNLGQMTDTAASATSGDKLLIASSSNSNAIKTADIAFDTTNTTDYLRKDGTWATPAGGGGSTDEVPYVTCSTGITVANKVVDLAGFTLAAGKRLYVCLTKGNSADQPTLNVNSTGAKYLRFNSTNLRNTYSGTYRNYIEPNRVIEVVYDGTGWEIVNGLQNALLATNGNNARVTSINRSIARGCMEYMISYSTDPTGHPRSSAKILHCNWDTNTIWASQIAVGTVSSTYPEGWLQYRGQNGSNSGTWTDWYDIPLERDGTCTLTDGNSFSFTANYHKIGKQVTIYGTIPSGGSATSLSGLPYAASGDFRGTIMFLANTLTNMMIGRLSTTASSTNLGVAGYASIGSVSGQSDTATWLSAIPSAGVPFTFTYLTATP